MRSSIRRVPPKRRSDDTQTADMPSVSRQIVSPMEQHLDFPLAPDEIASRLDLSVRSLERHCRLHFNQSPMRLYLRISGPQSPFLRGTRCEGDQQCLRFLLSIGPDMVLQSAVRTDAALIPLKLPRHAAAAGPAGDIEAVCEAAILGRGRETTSGGGTGTAAAEQFLTGYSIKPSGGVRFPCG
jgi:AraC-like DNA-binding protein